MSDVKFENLVNPENGTKDIVPGGKAWLNLTPHEVVVRLGPACNYAEIVLPSAGVCRVTATTTSVVPWFGYDFDLVRTEFGQVTGLPEPRRNVVYIVSATVRRALGPWPDNRPDVVCPDTGPTCIKEKGRVKAVTQFTVY